MNEREAMTENDKRWTVSSLNNCLELPNLPNPKSLPNDWVYSEKKHTWMDNSATLVIAYILSLWTAAIYFVVLDGTLKGYVVRYALEYCSTCNAQPFHASQYTVQYSVVRTVPLQR